MHTGGDRWGQKMTSPVTKDGNADPMIVADGPTGTAAGYRKSDPICLAGAKWVPDESANCPDDQPIPREASAVVLLPADQVQAFSA